MTQSSFLALSLTQSLAEKAIDSIQLGGKREVRNALELFHTFFNQLDVEYIPFSKSKYVTSLTTSYEGFIKEVVTRCRKDTLKHIMVGMIYEVFLKGNELNKNASEPWLQELYEYSQDEINNLNKKGVFAFVLRLNDENIKKALKLVLENPRCVFITYIDGQVRTLLDAPYVLPNIIYLLSQQGFNHYHRELHKNKCLFGILRCGNNLSYDMELEYIQATANDGAIFIAYYNENKKIDLPIYNELYKNRKSNKANIAICNFMGLIKNIQRRLNEESKRER